MKLFYEKTALIEDRELLETEGLLTDYVNHMRSVISAGEYEAPEASVNLPSDDNLLANILRIKEKKVSSALKYIVVIGIGGSNLGTQAVYNAMRGYADALEPDIYPKIFFADTNDNEFTKKLCAFLCSHITDPEEVLVIAVSKSGGTTETIVNTEFFMQKLKTVIVNVRDRLVVITDYNSKWWQVLEKDTDITRLSIPHIVGGRYSVFSAVGLFPLAAAGFDIKALRKGACDMRTLCAGNSIEENYAMQSAAVLYASAKKGKIINDNFFFHPECESLGKWYRQLMGESIGKEKDIDGVVVHAGITPTVSLGSVDLHSMAQLYLGGPRDKITTFVWSDVSGVKARIPERKDMLFPELVKDISGRTFEEIIHAIREGVKIAYQKNNLPFMEIILSELSEYELGMFLQFKMMEMMYLGKLMRLNVFDQPNVEAYKKETKNILETS
ncbi:MAG: hypothetical protein COU90_02710 [Candidatus Ryanbacteria bacterium CG10_big_fil_rev_8_21_14_0_10_43_42]|uniref:Glucose-6-phosphate isomerase n=1 Tax=Candidatus Ryanbacteria bacterium CG10_big_fil_rev_8_21_14_0_10_43_42 TaxID=1974864 RepID=A0A2M8KWM8_9BACT|nr:MAG: hypothetical protein COU90_02710 [Candidatus Ryanbacteria bacterium CG10_big_fil_rev_8_21_14_0_10_43_42]